MFRGLSEWDGEWISLSNAMNVAGMDFVRGVNRSMRWFWTSLTELSIAMRWFTNAKTLSGRALTKNQQGWEL